MNTVSTVDAVGIAEVLARLATCDGKSADAAVLWWEHCALIVAEVERWKARALTCAWCGLACANLAALKDHTTCCADHPVTVHRMRADAFEAEVKRLQQLTADLVERCAGQSGTLA